MNKMNPKVDAFLSKAEKWQAEFEKLRKIILDCPVTREARVEKCTPQILKGKGLND